MNLIINGTAEPTHLSILDPKSSAPTNFATRTFTFIPTFQRTLNFLHHNIIDVMWNLTIVFQFFFHIWNFVDFSNLFVSAQRNAEMTPQSLYLLEKISIWLSKNRNIDQKLNKMKNKKLTQTAEDAGLEPAYPERMAVFKTAPVPIEAILRMMSGFANWPLSLFGKYVNIIWCVTDTNTVQSSWALRVHPAI